MAQSNDQNGMPESYRKDQVVAIIKSLMTKVRDKHHALDEELSDGLHSLKDAIDGLKQELDTVRPGDIVNSHIPRATDELDAIINTTESATHVIISSCEKIQDFFKNDTGELSRQVGTEIVRIIEACTFQDITGQRITKIIKTLKEIDNKTSKLLSVLESSLDKWHGQSFSPPPQPGDSDKNLLNGPQLPGQGISQDEIDKLLAEFN